LVESSVLPVVTTLLASESLVKGFGFKGSGVSGFGFRV
jgi:hypothetical protein